MALENLETRLRLKNLTTDNISDHPTTADEASLKYILSCEPIYFRRKEHKMACMTKTCSAQGVVASTRLRGVVVPHTIA